MAAAFSHRRLHSPSEAGRKNRPMAFTTQRVMTTILRRYGLSPYRYSKQRYTTVMVKVSSTFVDETLWPEFIELSKVLDEYLTEITDKLIAESIFADTSEVETRNEPVRID